MEKLKMHTPDLTEANIQRIRELFPNCITETKDTKGNVKLAVDFDRLRQELSNSIVEGPQERYHLNWPGKREALLTANAPIAKTLRPCREESVNFDTTKNLFIEGDNLEALKLLQETYLGKVKMIYIDPPYNTGNDFIYEDDFAENTEEFLLKSNQKDDEGNRLLSNTDSNGRFHSDWLSMIYPRIKLARNLLSEDGLLFVSIDENEVSNLKHLINDIFGNDNFINTLVWKKRYNAAKEKHLAEIHEYVLIFAKNISYVNDFYVPGDKEYYEKHFTESDEFEALRGKFMTQPLEAGNSMDNRTNLRFPIISPDGSEIWPRRQWVWGQERVIAAQSSGHLKFYKNKEGEWKVRHKQYMKDENGNLRNVKPFSIYDKSYTQDGTRDIELVYGDANIFPFPKPIKFITHLLNLVDDKDAIILDFFAGSGTTAHAIIYKNSEDGGNRKFISVQLPELCDEKSPAYKAGYKTIAEISKDRVRLAGAKIKEGSSLSNLDIGFRVLKIDTSNMAEVYYTPDSVKQDDLLAAVDNIKPDRKPEDLLFQVLLDWGVDLSLPITKQTIQGKTVFFVDGNALVACFDNGITEELVKELAAGNPLRVVFRDNGFVSDSVKINAEQIFKQMSPGTDVKSI